MDYLYYQNIYNGNKISEEEFYSLAKKAELYIRSVIAAEPTPNEMNEAICAICDVLAEHGDSRGIKSESVDGISVTYESERVQKLLYNTLKLYLPSRVLYRGL